MTDEERKLHKKEYQREYRAKNRKKLNEYHREYNRKHQNCKLKQNETLKRKNKSAFDKYFDYIKCNGFITYGEYQQKVISKK